MISSHAMKPGDIVTASNGKTIEILNTDAEGRLTLADALVYADNLHVDSVVDLATLTGACVVALGEEAAGLYCDNSKLREQLEKAARVSALYLVGQNIITLTRFLAMSFGICP